MKKVLFENDYCQIYEKGLVWYRYDKVLKTTVDIPSYFDENNIIRRNNVRLIYFKFKGSDTKEYVKVYRGKHPAKTKEYREIKNAFNSYNGNVGCIGWDTSWDREEIENAILSSSLRNFLGTSVLYNESI